MNRLVGPLYGSSQSFSKHTAEWLAGTETFDKHAATTVASFKLQDPAASGSRIPL